MVDGGSAFQAVVVSFPAMTLVVDHGEMETAVMGRDGGEWIEFE